MKSFLVVSWAVCLCLTSGVTSAIGFGKTVVESSVGQPLLVKVPLVFVKSGELDGLSIGLAAPSWYTLSGIEYPDISEQIAVTLDRQIPGKPVIVLSTADGIDQVVVPVVLELTWPQKIIRRQITALLNPTGYIGDIVTGPVERTGYLGVNTDTGAGSRQVTDNPAPAILFSNTVRSGAVASNRTGVVRVAPGDSLSTIVDRYLPPGANRYQGRMAFYQLNNDAFQNGDIHLLPEGVELTVPSDQAILDTPRTEAKRDYVKLARIDQFSTLARGSTGSTQNGYQLSLLEVPESEAADSANADDAGAAQSGFAPASENSSIAAGGSANSQPGQNFEMQGFSLKLTVLNAYIVELQDENRQLTQRVANLEMKMEELIRDSGQGQAVMDQGAIETLSTDSADAVNQADELEIAGTLEPLVAEGSVESANNSQPADNGSDVAATDPPGEPDIAADGSGIEVGTTDEESKAAQSGAVNGDLETAEVEPALQQSTAVEPGASALTSPQSDQVVQDQEPRVVYRDNLISRVKNFAAKFYTPLMQLLLAVLLLGVMLFVWMLRRGRKNRQDDAEDADRDESSELSFNEEVGVTFEGASQEAALDINDDDERWLFQQDISEKDLDSMQESDVDLFTQSEVYLTYDRPLQAVQALLEEYAKADSDKFVVAARILKVYEKMGDNEARNTSLGQFIVLLNDDIELFSTEKWDALRNDLDALRKNEQLVAVDHSALDLRMSGVTEKKKFDERPMLAQEEDDDEDNGLVDLEVDYSDLNRTK